MEKQQERNPFNEENGEFKIRLSKFETKENLAIMKLIGVRNRGQWLSMCIAAGKEKYAEK